MAVLLPSLFVAGLEPSRVVHGIHPYVPRTKPHTANEVRWATALYDAEIHHADAWVGRLIDETRERFGSDELLVVLTSDHGETLGEFDATQLYAFDHGKLLARHALDTIPVFDGMAAAGGCLYVSTVDGSVLCLSGRDAPPLHPVADRPERIEWGQPEDPGYLLPVKTPKRRQ